MAYKNLSRGFYGYCPHERVEGCLESERKIRQDFTESGNLSLMVAILCMPFLVFLSGCTIINGMTGTDKFYQDEGYILHCTEVAGDTCLTRQWLKQPSNTYQRYHNKGETNE